MITKRIRSFKYAIDGIIHCYAQPNMIIHGVAAVFVILLGIVLKLSLTEWGIIFVTIGLVKTTEAINTAIEKLVDLVSPGHNEKAGLVKDISAGAVLLASLVAVGVALVVLLPKIIQIFK
jgi:diacylglycerol kinase (ATP)